MNVFHANYAMGVGAPGWLPLFGIPLLLLVVWSIFWKGLALWHSAGRKQGWWFIVLLIVNTGGILEIIYLFAILHLKFHDLFEKNKISV